MIESVKLHKNTEQINPLIYKSMSNGKDRNAKEIYQSILYLYK